MAAKIKAKYQANNGDIHPIRLNQETLNSAGPQPAGAITSSLSADVRKGKREYGLGPRGVMISQTLGTTPDTFKRYAFLPVLSEASYDAGNFVIGGTVSYKDNAWTVESLVPESVK